MVVQTPGSVTVTVLGGTTAAAAACWVIVTAAACIVTVTASAAPPFSVMVTCCVTICAIGVIVTVGALPALKTVSVTKESCTLIVC